MKRIDAVIQPDMLDPVIKALRKVGVGGFSVMEARGQGAAEPPLVGQFFSKNIYFTFFLDHPKEKENDKLMGEKVFSNTLEAFYYLKNKNIGFNVHMRVSKHNCDKIEKMNFLIKEYGADNLVPTEIYPIGKAD